MDFFKKAIATITGYGFFGLALLGYAAIAFVFGLGFVGWGLVGAFIGKNMQAIKEAISEIKF